MPSTTIGLMRILGRTDLSIADGMPLVWGSRWLGTPLRERVAGADLVPALVERAAAEGYRVYFFGAAPTVAASAAAVLRERYPGAEIVADAGPMFADPADMDPAALVPIKAARPDICCIALGNPKQELWIDRFGADVGAPVVIGVGGTLDFVSGAKRRAPGWAQRFGLEWVHRAVTEPRRLIRRYARDLIVFAPRLARQVWATRPGRRPWRRSVSGPHDVVRTGGIVTVRLGGPSRALDEHEWREIEVAADDGHAHRRRSRRLRPYRRPRHRHDRRDRPDRGPFRRRRRARSHWCHRRAVSCGRPARTPARSANPRTSRQVDRIECAAWRHEHQDGQWAVVRIRTGHIRVVMTMTGGDPDRRIGVMP